MRTTTVQKAGLIIVILLTLTQLYLGMSGYLVFLLMFIVTAPPFAAALWFLLFRRNPRKRPTPRETPMRSIRR